MEAVGEAAEPRLEPVEAVGQAVVGDDRRDGGEQADGGGEQRLGNARRDDRERGVVGAGDGGEARMMPQTVPNRPTNGATEPTVARMLRRSPRRSSSAATAAFIRLARRSRVPARSTTAAAGRAAPFVEPGGEDRGGRQLLRAALGVEGVDVVGRPEVALDRPRSARLMRRRRSAWVKMIAQVQMLAQRAGRASRLSRPCRPGGTGSAATSGRRWRRVRH